MLGMRRLPRRYGEYWVDFWSWEPLVLEASVRENLSLCGALYSVLELPEVWSHSLGSAELS